MNAAFHRTPAAVAPKAPSQSSGTPWVVLGLLAGAALALRVVPTAAPALAASLTAAQPRTFWYLSRASGLVAYGLLSLSVLLGLLLSTKLAKTWPGSATAFALHEHASLLSLAFGAFHALALLGDAHTRFTLGEIAVPFGLAKRTFELGMGQVALYGMALVVGSFYVRKHIGQRAWRVLHVVTFAVFVLGLAHGLAASTDRGVMLLGVVPAVITVAFVVYRLGALVVGAGGARPGARKPAMA